MGRLKPKTRTTEGRIKAKKIPEDLIYFSFKYLDCNSEKFHFKNQNNVYFCNLVERLVVVSGFTTQSFTTTKGHKALRAHRIHFDENGVTEDTLSIPGLGELDDEAWQFSISQTEGRVHGALIDNMFYVRWIDPEHNLYQ